MKNATHLLAVMLILSGIVSCQKETGTELDTTPSGDKVKTYTEDITSTFLGNSVTTYTLGYDASDRIVSFTSMSDPGNKYLYTYNSTGGFSLDIYSSGQLGIHENVFLNASMNIDSTFYYNDTQDSATEKYIYNAANQLIKYYEYDYSKIDGTELANTTTYSYDSNGNITREEDTDGKALNYTYYTDLVYAYPKISPVQRSGKYNLIKTITLDTGGGVTDTYTFDDKNRIVTDKAVASDGGIVIKTYTYF